MSSEQASAFTAEVANEALAALERCVDVAWALSEIAPGTVSNHAHETLCGLVGNAIRVLAPLRERTTITVGSLLRTGTSTAVTRHAFNHMLSPEYHRVMRWVLAVAAAEEGFGDVDFALLFSDIGKAGSSDSRPGVTPNGDAGVLGLALSGRAASPIVALHELLEGSRDSLGHPAYDPQRAWRYADELGLEDGLPRCLREEVIALLAGEHAGCAAARVLAAAEDSLNDHAVDSARLVRDGFPQTVVATELRVLQHEGRGWDLRYLGTDEQLVTALLDDGFEPVLQAVALTAGDSARSPEEIVEDLWGMDAPELSWATKRDLGRINRANELLTATGLTIVPDTTRYWTATQVLDDRELCVVGRLQLGTASQQVFRVGPTALDADAARARTFGFVEIAARRAMPLDVRAQLTIVPPLRLGGQRVGAHRTMMAIIDTAYALLLAARTRLEAEPARTPVARGVGTSGEFG